MAEEKPKSGMNRVPIVTILILLSSLVSYLFPEVADFFVFDRKSIGRGELWRLFSAHLTHFNLTHLAYNLLAFGAVGWIVERKNRLHFFLLFLFLAICISSSLWVLKPAMRYYGGLSGIASGFIFYAALFGTEEPGPFRMVCLAVLIFIPVKIFLEIIQNASILPYPAQVRFVTMPISHLTGVTAAVLFYIALKSGKEKTNRKQSKIPLS